VHQPTPEDEKLAAEIGAWAIERLAYRADTIPPRRRDPGDLPPIAATGVGATEAWHVLRDLLIPTAIPADHPRYLAFVGGSPSVAAVLADMAISAAGVYAGSALEGGAVVAAEASALRWLAAMAGLPPRARGTFVSGGSIANLSALVAARHGRRTPEGNRPGLIVAGTGAHASVASAAEIMGCDVVLEGDADGRLDGSSLGHVLADVRPADIAAVVATAGATNTGAVDDLAGVAEVCREHGLWLHVDAAYGGAALLSERTRPQFAGIESADSVTIDPHKWLFTPFDCAAVIYRDPQAARRAHTQVASYLEPTAGVDDDNPSDYAIHLTRRARAIPLWLSLLANGTDAYRDAVETCLDLADYAAACIAAAPHVELVRTPGLSVVLFRRIGWSAARYRRWSAAAIDSGLGLITPTEFRDETVLRLCFVNPVTSSRDVDRILAALE
jgi:L-2,4-diaminobutyrate decarboxylase